MWATDINVLTHTHALFFSTHTTVLHWWQTGTWWFGTEKKSADRHLAKWYIPTHTDTPSTTFLIYKHLSIANCTSVCLLCVLCYPHKHSKDIKIVYQASNVHNSNQFFSHNHRYQENRFISSLKQFSWLIFSLKQFSRLILSLNSFKAHFKLKLTTVFKVHFKLKQFSKFGGVTGLSLWDPKPQEWLLLEKDTQF